MGGPKQPWRAGTIVWALLLGGFTIVLGSSIILPSTKRSHLDFRKLQDQNSEAGAATLPSSEPATNS